MTARAGLAILAPAMRTAARHAPLALVLLTCGAVLAFTRAEFAISREPLNDFALHQPLAAALADVMRAGGNPLDAWIPEWSLGHPIPRTYQPLAPLVVAGLDVLMGGRLDITTIFVWCHWLMLGLMPLAMFGGARLLGLSPGAAAAGGVLSPLVSTDLLFGLAVY